MGKYIWIRIYLNTNLFELEFIWISFLKATWIKSIAIYLISTCRNLHFLNLKRALFAAREMFLNPYFQS